MSSNHGSSSNPPTASQQPSNGGGPSSSTQQQDYANQDNKPKKKKKRGGKKHKRDKRQSFSASDELPGMSAAAEGRPSLADVPEGAGQDARDNFYRMGRGAAGSTTSLESEALLDHRDSGPLQARRQSIVQGIMPGRFSMPSPRQGQRPSYFPGGPQNASRLRRSHRASGTDEDDESTDRTPLLATSAKNSSRYGGFRNSPREETSNPFHRNRRPSSSSSRKRNLGAPSRPRDSRDQEEDYDVNNPPSRPGSPKFGADMGFDDVMLAGTEMDRGRSEGSRSREVLIDIDDNAPIDRLAGQTPEARRGPTAAEDDVCFPHEDVTEIGEEDAQSNVYRRRRRRRREWPDLEVLEEWAGEEKEQRTLDNIRARQVNEPVMVNGRLRPTKQPWHRDVDNPLRFTYFNEDYDNTLHSESLSELLHDDLSFRDLFMPEPKVLSDSESDSEDESTPAQLPSQELREGSVRGKNATLSPKSSALSPSGRVPSIAGSERPSSRVASDRKITPVQSQSNSNEATGTNTPTQQPQKIERPVRFGATPIWWLDVICPTEPEMKVLSRAFGIHPLTAEDVMMQEQREKVELFRNYYFVTYRSFEQDSNNEDYMEPVSMYVVVFREGVISFHFSQTPHPANVRRRIRQLKDYLTLTTDWISYAIIDDITDSYAPLIERIEEEVDQIDEAILRLHAQEHAQERQQSVSKVKRNLLGRTYDKISGDKAEKQSLHSENEEPFEAGDMIRAVGECRKKVMGLYRLLGNKADVIKGFAKRCNEQWDIAPKSDIGLYLGDIQDHIVTMTGNLSHYENLLSRAHSNYLAQINIRMNERAEKTNDVLGKLTVLGTIVLPMNIVTGLWGMNCLVPGQDIENLNWFWCITAGLFVFGFTCYFIAKRAYGIV